MSGERVSGERVSGERVSGEHADIVGFLCVSLASAACSPAWHFQVPWTPTFLSLGRRGSPLLAPTRVVEYELGVDAKFQICLSGRP